MSADDSKIEDLFARAYFGDRSAIGRLLEQHRRPLRRFIAARLDRRLAARVDPSDVVQDALTDAGRRLPEFLRDRPVGFFAWLQRLALQRLIGSRRFHLGSSKRSVGRELAQGSFLAETLVHYFAGSDTSPSGRLIHDEDFACVRRVVEALSASDQEILDLRYVQDLPFPEIADRLGIGLGAVKMRHLRAIERVRAGLDENQVGTVPI